jgi:hypothetical protein
MDYQGKVCPICGSSDLLVQGQSVTGQVLLGCGGCGHVCFADMPTLGQLDEYYSKAYTDTKDQSDIQEANRAYYASHAAQLLQIARQRGTPLTLVDVGSSLPILCQEALAAGFTRAIAIEPSEAARAYAAGTGVEVISAADLEACLGGTMAGVLRYSHVLEHLIDPLDVLRSNVRFLDRRGFVHITQPSFPVVRHASHDVVIKDSVWPEHLHFFAMPSLEQLLKRAGLEPFEIWTFQNEQATRQQYAGVLDPDGAKSFPEAWRGLYPAGAPELGVYPHFLGENSVVYAALAPETASA